MATYLITGVAGFIGSALATALVHEGHTVRGFDNLSSGSLQNLEDIRPAIDLRVGDIRDLNALRQACSGVDFVFHEAAIASVPRSVDDPMTSHDVNVTGTLNVLLAARDSGVRRVVYAASSSAYGDGGEGAKDEAMCPQPLSPYAVQKLAGEHYVQAFSSAYGMEGVCLRYFNIFGPRQAADSPYSGVIARFIDLMLSGQRPTINGDGLASRDFTFVGNVVRANLLACHAPADRVSGRVYNIGTGRSQTLNELFAALAGIIGFKHAPRYGPSRVGDVQHSRADIGRAVADLKYAPAYDFQTGLQETVNWYQSIAAATSSR